MGGPSTGDSRPVLAIRMRRQPTGPNVVSPSIVEKRKPKKITYPEHGEKHGLRLNDAVLSPETSTVARKKKLQTLSGVTAESSLQLKEN